MSPEVSKEITIVVQSFRVCQKLAKLVSRPKVTLLRLSTFNEVGTLDLKAFESKYVIWIIDSFNRFLYRKGNP